MSGELRHFDPDGITAVWSLRTGGSVNLAVGLIDGGGSLTISKDAPLSSRTGDRQGNMTINVGTKRGATLTATYHPHSETQDTLSALALQHHTTGPVVGDILIRDLNGTTLVEMLGAHIENTPDPSWGDVAGDRVFVFGCAEMIAHFGGSNVL